MDKTRVIMSLAFGILLLSGLPTNTRAPTYSLDALELIVNGGFEDTYPDPFGWIPTPWADEVAFPNDPLIAHSGSGCVSMGGIGLNGTGEAHVEQKFDPAVYADSDLTLWARGYNGSASTLVVWIFYNGYTITHTKPVIADWSLITIPIDKTKPVFSIRIATYDDLGNIYTTTRIVDDVSMLGSRSNLATIFNEDFEGTFPEPNWNYPYDSNHDNDDDYWDDTFMKSHGGGSYSAWCAEVGTQFVNYTVWSENFEGEFPTSNYQVYDQDPGSGYDSWGKTDYRSFDGVWSAWCAQNGSQFIGPEWVYNWEVHKYDNDMDTWLLRDVDLSGYSFFTFSFWYWIDSEPHWDTLQVAYYDMLRSEVFRVDIASGNSGDWIYTEVNIPAATGFVAILFGSDSTNKDYEGAYVDNMALIGAVEVPNRSIPQYDDNMMASMYRQVNLTGYSSATLSYWYWIDSEFGHDYLQVIYSNSSGWFYVDIKQGNSGGWQYSETAIPTTANYVGFYFRSDFTVHNYEGAYVDDILLIGLIPPGILEGTVAELGSGTPLADAIVSAGGQTVVTNASGHFQFALEAGVYKVIVRTDYYYSTFVKGVSVVAGMTTIQDIMLTPGYPSVTNGGFESGDLTGWPSVDVEGLPIEPSPNVTVTNIGARSGAYSLKLEGEAQVLQVYTEPAMLKGSLTFWAKCMNQGVTSSISLAVMTDPSISPITYRFSLGDTWTKMVIPVSETSHWILVAFATYLPDFPSSGVAPEAKLIDDVWIGYAPLVESCDQAGTRKDVYNETETVYVYGSGYLPTFLCNVYVVEDATWTDGKPIAPGSVTLTTTWSNGTGHVNAAPVYYPPLALGKYDVVVDVNDNGKYDIGIDALDDNDVEVTAGLVIPEFPSFLILPLFMITTLLAVIVYRRKHTLTMNRG